MKQLTNDSYFKFISEEKTQRKTNNVIAYENCDRTQKLSPACQ